MQKSRERGDICAELMAGSWCLSQVSLRWNGGVGGMQPNVTVSYFRRLFTANSVLLSVSSSQIGCEL